MYCLAVVFCQGMDVSAKFSIGIFRSYVFKESKKKTVLENLRFRETHLTCPSQYFLYFTPNKNSVVSVTSFFVICQVH